MAVIYPDGSVYVQDRSKDIIISGGENASSLAIEQGTSFSVCLPKELTIDGGLFLELAAHPDILEVSVVARPHPKWGERPMAFVILKTQVAAKWKGKDAEFETELKRHAKTRLPGFACPEWVKVVEELPVSLLCLVTLHDTGD